MGREDDPDPWCTSPEEPSPVEQTDHVQADYYPDRWGSDDDEGKR